MAEGSVPPSLDECQATARVLRQWKGSQTYGQWSGLITNLSVLRLFQNDIQVRKILKENVKGRKRMRPFEYSLVSVDSRDDGHFQVKHKCIF